MSPRELERFFRTQGYSQRAAKIAVSEARKQGLTKELSTVGKWLAAFRGRKKDAL